MRPPPALRRLAFALGLSACFLVDAPAAAGAPKRVIVIPIEEQIDFGLHAFLERAVQRALEKKPDALVFKVNTYGGELQAAFDIVDLLTGIARCSTYAYVEQKAISAGALISLACNRIAMGPGTTLGDCAPITQGQDGIVMLGEKIQSPLRAKFRTLAERNGYPALPAQAMVTSDLGVIAAVPSGGGGREFFTAKQWESLGPNGQARYASHQIVVPEGQLLTLTDREAADLGFSLGTYATLDDFLKAKGFAKIGEEAESWSEGLVRLIGKFAPILMMIGFGALYLEFKTPGLSVFGVIGALCLLIVFGSKYAVGLADHTELVLLLIGFALVAAEIYLLPGTFILGGLGLAVILIALTLSLQSFTVPAAGAPWEWKSLLDNLLATFGSALVALLIPLAGAKYVLPRLPKRARVISEATLADARATAAAATHVALGAKGKTKTPLRPSGKAVFSGETVEVSSRDGFVEAGRPVEVCRIEGNRIVVRAAEAGAPPDRGTADPGGTPASGPAAPTSGPGAPAPGPGAPPSGPGATA
jgi:membrane-bound serine protease (ClpP class)